MLKRWARYGHDRLYAHTPDGHRLGYWDNKAGTAHLEDETYRDAFTAALAAAGLVATEPTPTEPIPLQRQSATREVPLANEDAVEALPTTHPDGDAHEPTDRAVTPPAEPEWNDLAENRAGAAVREQAHAAKAEARVKTFVARLFGVHGDERAWRLGADGEEAVAKRLRKLDDRWRTLHSVPVGAGESDIDHVVIGPGGVYTVNAKNHPNASIWVGGNTFMVTANGFRTFGTAATRPSAPAACSPKQPAFPSS